ncbi:MAG: hypothetical protein GEU73_00545 [Chloroflexi bacterium]|nr:hypothetical protein [Chloroflexota bacterium]
MSSCSDNHKIKRCGVAMRTVTTWSGTGVAGHADGPRESAAFNEPSGMSAALGRIYVADTNNHAVRVIDLATDEVSTLRVQGL